MLGRLSLTICVCLVLLRPLQSAEPPSAYVPRPIEANEVRFAALENELAQLKERLSIAPEACGDVCCEPCSRPSCDCEPQGGFYAGAALVMTKPHFKEAVQTSLTDALTGTLP